MELKIHFFKCRHGLITVQEFFAGNDISLSNVISTSTVQADSNWLSESNKCIYSAWKSPVQDIPQTTQRPIAWIFLHFYSITSINSINICQSDATRSRLFSSPHFFCHPVLYYFCLSIMVYFFKFNGQIMHESNQIFYSRLVNIFIFTLSLYIRSCM